MADKAAPTGKAKRMGGTGATAIPERNDELSGGDNGLIADERRPTAKAGVIWKEDAQGQPALPGKASRKTIGYLLYLFGAELSPVPFLQT